MRTPQLANLRPGSGIRCNHQFTYRSTPQLSLDLYRRRSRHFISFFGVSIHHSHINAFLAELRCYDLFNIVDLSHTVSYDSGLLASLHDPFTSAHYYFFDAIRFMKLFDYLRPPINPPRDTSRE